MTSWVEVGTTSGLWHDWAMRWNRALATVDARLRAESPIDLVVNNAGFGQAGSLHELDAERETAVIDVNVVALHRLSQVAAGLRGIDQNRAVVVSGGLNKVRAGFLNALPGPARRFLVPRVLS